MSFMSPEIKAFQQQLQLSQISAFYSSKIFTNIEATTADEITTILQKQLERYLNIPDVIEKIGSKNTIEEQFDVIFKIFPSSILTIVDEFYNNDNCKVFAKDLYIAAIITNIINTSSQFDHIELFHKHLDPKEDLKTLNEKTFDADVVPTQVHQYVGKDFMMLTQNLIRMMSQKLSRIQPTKNNPEIIENMFCFLGISQIMLRYYFDLVCTSKSDVISQYINRIFSRLLATLRIEEIRYWKAYGNAEIIKSRMSAIIEKNDPKLRHPKLNKELFLYLSAYNPIIHNGTSRGVTASTQNFLKSQLAVFYTLSVVQLSLLLEILYKFMGSNYAVYLITQLARSEKKKSLSLYEHLHLSNDSKLGALEKLVHSILSRLFPADIQAIKLKPKGGKSLKLQTSRESERLKYAKKKLEEIKDQKGMMTHDKVTKFLADRLKRLYERVRIKGALTQDKIPEYLAQFAAVAHEVLKEITPAERKEVLEIFEESTEDILNEITENSEMSVKEVNDIKVEIKVKIEKMDTDDVEKRTELVEQIGITLSDTSEKVEVQKEKINVGEFLKQEIAVGFDKMSPKMPLSAFFSLPLGPRKGPEEENPFEYQMKFLELSVEKKAIGKKLLDTSLEILPELPLVKYKKYFNIFPNNNFEDTTLSAVYDIWKNDAIGKLIIN